MADTFLILYDGGTLELTEKFLRRCSKTRMRKALQLLFREPCRNEETVARIDEFLKKEIKDAEEHNREVKRWFTLVYRPSHKMLVEAELAEKAVKSLKQKRELFLQMKEKLQ